MCYNEDQDGEQPTDQARAEAPRNRHQMPDDKRVTAQKPGAFQKLHRPSGKEPEVTLVELIPCSRMPGLEPGAGPKPDALTGEGRSYAALSCGSMHDGGCTYAFNFCVRLYVGKRIGGPLRHRIQGLGVARGVSRRSRVWSALLDLTHPIAALRGRTIEQQSPRAPCRTIPVPHGDP